jgi:hypothetical protein
LAVETQKTPRLLEIRPPLAFRWAAIVGAVPHRPCLTAMTSSTTYSMNKARRKPQLSYLIERPLLPENRDLATPLIQHS